MADVTVISGEDELERSYAIRRTVFIEEQAVPEELEFDGFEKTSTHFLLHVDGQPAATGRLRIVDGCAKLERIAVLREHRGRGHGLAITRAMMDAGREAGSDRLVLDAQLVAVGFYEKLGFRRFGDTFMDAGIEHVKMELGSGGK
jgi:predicted GNAT family N-acyltransferase